MKNLILIFFLCIVLNDYTQEIIIEGKTTNSEKKTNIPYVNIGILNKNTGTISDQEGNFRLS